MKHNIMISSLILCILSLGLTIQLETRANSSAAMAMDQDTFAENLLLQAYSYLQLIDNTIGEIAILVTKGVLKNSPKPKAILKALEYDRKTIGHILRDQANVVAIKNPALHIQYASNILQICDAFIAHLESGLFSNFRKTQSFESLYGQVMKRGKSRTITPQLLLKNIEITEKKLDSLRKTTDNVGLTWYNKFFRKADKYIVTPAYNYHIPTIVTYGAGVTFLGGYILCKNGNFIKSPYWNDKERATLLDKTITWLQTTFPLLRYNPNTGQLEPVGSKAVSPHQQPSVGIEPISEFSNDTNTKRGILALTEATIAQCLSGHEAITTLIGGMVLNAGKEQWKAGISPIIAQKQAIAWNYLRGGSYLEKKVQGMYGVNPDHTFDDMVGLDEVKRELSFIIQFLDNPEQYTRIKAAPEQGILLTGASRTGKSFSFECLCGEIIRMQQKRGKQNAFKFFNIDASDIAQHGIKQILGYAKENAPIVLFIDEIDLLGLQRSGTNPILSEFLTAMQSSMDKDPSKVVILIAATNKPENLDKALRQNGRFGKEIRFETPAKKYRIQFIIRELTNMALDLKQFDPVAIAEKTNGKTFEDLYRILRHAMRTAWMLGQSLTQKLIEDSIDTEIHHIITQNRKDLPEKELRILASHFAGRAVATLLLETNAHLDKVTIHARMSDIIEESAWADLFKKDEKEHQQKIEYGAILTRYADDTVSMKNKAYIVNEAQALLAGFAAEEILLGSCGRTCHSRNAERAYQLIEQLVFGGLNPEKLAKDVKTKLSQQTYDLFKQCETEVAHLLQQHHDALAAVADALIINHIMTDKEIQAIITKIEQQPEQPALVEPTPEPVEQIVVADEAIKQNETIEASATMPTSWLTPHVPTEKPAESIMEKAQEKIEALVKMPHNWFANLTHQS